MECEKCLHKRICDLWRSLESQDACCYGEDYFEKEKAKSNADRIRAMSDEELARWLFNFFWGNKTYIRLYSVIDWLRQPSEED